MRKEWLGSMDFVKDILPMLFSFLGIVLVLYLSYVTSKYLAGKASKTGNSRSIRLLERVALGQDKGLAIAEICKQYYLISFCEHRIEILKELPGYEETVPASKGEFHEILLQNIKERFGTGGKNEK